MGEGKLDIGFCRLRDLGDLPHIICESHGEIALDDIFNEQKLNPELLKLPHAAVPTRQFIGLFHNASIITGLRSIGIEAGKSLQFSQLGPCMAYVFHATSLRDALIRLTLSLPLRETGSRFEVTIDGNECTIRYRNMYESVCGWRHVGDVKLCMMLNLIRRFFDDNWKPIRIETSYRPGPWIQDLEGHFDAQVKTGADGNALVFDLQDQRSARSLQMQQEVNDTLTLADLENSGIRPPRSLREAVVTLIDQNISDSAFGLEDVATSLGFGPRSLQRRLENSGDCYRSLALECRMRRAKQLLTHSEISVGDVASKTGYASASQFIRAFGNNLEVTPASYREAAAVS